MYVTKTQNGTNMIDYDALDEKQREHFTKVVENLASFRSHADYIMYFSDNTPSDGDLKKFREAYDLVCKAMDIIN